MKKRILYIVGGLALLIAGLAALPLVRGGAGGATQNAEEAIPVAAAPAARGSLSTTIRLTAEFRPYQEIDVHAKVAGYIASIPVDIGDRMKAGGLIATLEIPELGPGPQESGGGSRGGER